MKAQLDKLFLIYNKLRWTRLSVLYIFPFRIQIISRQFADINNYIITVLIFFKWYFFLQGSLWLFTQPSSSKHQRCPISTEINWWKTCKLMFTCPRHRCFFEKIQAGKCQKKKKKKNRTEQNNNKKVLSFSNWKYPISDLACMIKSDKIKFSNVFLCRFCT